MWPWALCSSKVISCNDSNEKSALLGYESVAPATTNVPTYVNATHMDTAYPTPDSWPDHLSMSAISDENHQYAPTDQALDVSVWPPLALAGTLFFSTVSGCESVSSTRSEEKKSKPFICFDCGKRFALKQSVGRHYRKRHDPNKCLFSSCDFKWGGPYDYRYHLKGEHKMKNKVIDKILGKTAHSQGRGTIIGRNPFPPPLLPFYITD